MYKYIYIYIYIHIYIIFLTYILAKRAIPRTNCSNAHNIFLDAQNNLSEHMEAHSAQSRAGALLHSDVRATCSRCSNKMFWVFEQLVPGFRKTCYIAYHIT